MRTRWVILALAALLLVGGCTLDRLRSDVVDLQGKIEAYELQIEATRAHKVDLEEAIINMPPGEERDKAIGYVGTLDAWLLKAEGALNKLKGSLGRIEKDLELAEDEAEGLGIIGREAAEYLPEPWKAFGIFFAGLIPGLVRAGQNRHNARKVIASVDGSLALTEKDKEKISLAQGKGGKRLVDEAQRKKWALPF